MKPYVTPAEAAMRLGVHPTTVIRWADQGLLAVYRTPGGHRRFLATDLERLATPEVVA
jgi:excisionase family DNA binding protein